MAALALLGLHSRRPKRWRSRIEAIDNPGCSTRSWLQNSRRPETRTGDTVVLDDARPTSSAARVLRSGADARAIAHASRPQATGPCRGPCSVRLTLRHFRRAVRPGQARIGPVDDPLEREADSIAHAVVRDGRLRPSVQREPAASGQRRLRARTRRRSTARALGIFADSPRRHR